jgi:hypothetical protein
MAFDEQRQQDLGNEDAEKKRLRKIIVQHIFSEITKENSRYQDASVSTPTIYLKNGRPV